MKNKLMGLLFSVPFTMVSLTTIASEAQQNNSMQKTQTVSAADPFDDPFFQTSDDVFIQMDRMQQAMDQLIKSQLSQMQRNVLGEPHPRAFGNRNNIEILENKNELIYKIKLSQKDDSKIDVSVKEGQLLIRSNIQQKVIHEEGNSKSISYSNSNYSQAFQLPQGYDPNSMTTQRKDANLIITFKKT